MLIHLEKLKESNIKASWSNPRNGEKTLFKSVKNKEPQLFEPPGREKEGNDWVLVLEEVEE